MARARRVAFRAATTVLAAAACSDAVGPRPPSHLVFEIQPLPIGVGLGFAPTVVVSIRDTEGQLTPEWSQNVTIALEGGTGGGVLTGHPTRAPLDGLAAFPGLGMSAAGTSYTLVARSPGLPDGRSAAFDVPDVFRSARAYVGEAHSCALDAEGAAWCWGAGKHGQIGDGAMEDRRTPTATASALRFSSLSLGSRHTCGLTEEGTVYCWGRNDSGQVGIGTMNDAPSPRAVALPGTTVSVTAGYAHTCALLEGGRPFCWGANGAGLLGTGSSDPFVVTPEPVAGEWAFAFMTAGYYATCGLAPSGAAYCWGDNEVATLGDGTREHRSAPTPVAGGHRFRWIRTGGVRLHSMTCGLGGDGVVYCWGRGWGDLVSTPEPLLEDPGCDALSPAGWRMCGTTGSGALYCWGRGGLGTGFETYSPTPVRVLGSHSVASVAVGPSHICAVTTDGETWCWGSNGSGALGNASHPVGWEIPVPVWAPGG